MFLGAIIPAIIGATMAGVEMANQPSAPKDNTAKEQAAAAKAQADSLQKRRGMASTILTSPLGTSTGQKSTLG